MCRYLFAAFSLKQSTEEGLSDRELEAVTRWRRVVSNVATEEMLHLALVAVAELGEAGLDDTLSTC